MENHGLLVSYFTEEPEAQTPTPKARAVFNLRDVTLLRPTTDSTAPATAVEVCVARHNLTVDFQVPQERAAWLRIWVNAVPPSALPDAVRVEFAE